MLLSDVLSSGSHESFRKEETAEPDGFGQIIVGYSFELVDSVPEVF